MQICISKGKEIQMVVEFWIKKIPVTVWRVKLVLSLIFLTSTFKHLLLVSV